MKTISEISDYLRANSDYIKNEKPESANFILSHYAIIFSEVCKSLGNDEEVIYVEMVKHITRKNSSKMRNGVVAVTNKRLILAGLLLGFLKNPPTANAYNIDKISSISVSSGVLKSIMIESTAGDDCELVVWNFEQANDICFKLTSAIDGVRDSLQQNKVIVSAAPTQQAGSSAGEIREFKKLLDEGIITQEEFDAKKKQLLGL